MRQIFSFTFVQVVLLSVLLSGCSNPERQKIVGVWEIDRADKVSDRVPQPEVETDVAAEDFAGTMEVHFFWSGQLKTVTRIPSIDRVKTGNWELVSSDDDTSIVRCTLTDPNVGAQTTELEIRWVDEDTVRMTPPNMAGLKMKLKFNRK